MSQSSTSNHVETLVGAAVVALAIGFFFYASKTAGVGGTVSGGYRVTAEFDNAEGINVGTDVRLAGIKIGTVTGQTLNTENYMAKLELTLDPSVSLSEDTAAKVTSEGLLGGKFISMEPGGADVKLAEGSSMSVTQGAVDIWSLISSAMFDKAKSPGTESPAPPAPESEPQPQ
jgi:phospholipid/cholesterol/gamma-HCH transport system substrate-binding protein